MAAPFGRDHRDVPAAGAHLVLDAGQVLDEPLGRLVRAVDEEEHAVGFGIGPASRAGRRAAVGPPRAVMARTMRSRGGRGQGDGPDDGTSAARHGPAGIPESAPTLASGAMTHPRLGPTGAAAILGCAGLMLVGWSGLLVPSLIRSIEHDFGQSDAGIGVLFFVGAVGYVAGTLGGGLLTERFGRRIVLSLAVVLIVGWASPAWRPSRRGASSSRSAFPFGLASGAIDGGIERAHPRSLPDEPGPGAQPAPPLLQPRGACLAAGGRPAR